MVMATLSELVNQTLNEETPGIIIPAGNDLAETIDVGRVGKIGTGRLPKLKIWFISEQNTVSSQITGNPTESGRVQNDNIILEPQSWSIRAKVTDVMGQFSISDLESLGGAFAATLTPGAEQFFKRAGSGVSNSVYTYLMFLRELRLPFKIVTSFGRVQNLFFENISFDRNKDTANSLPIQMTLKELFISGSSEAEATGAINPGKTWKDMVQSPEGKGQQTGVPVT